MYKISKQLLRVSRMQPNLWGVMKLTTLLLIAIVMQISAKTKAQKISLSVKNQKLTEVFNQITHQTGYSFVFTNSILNDLPKVTLQVKEMELNDVLKKIFQDKQIEYSIDQTLILLKRKEKALTDKIIDKLFSLDIRGKILDEKGAALVGATVSVKGTEQETKTDEQGNFYLGNVPENSILRISYIGYQTLELPSKANLGSIILKIATAELQEIAVVSTGYQTLPKERATGSYATISSKKLEQQRLSSLGSLLEGRVAGYNNGLIRGTSTMQGLTTPLYVIDGFPIENAGYSPTGGIDQGIPGVNLEDIETITILKDAAAASIYGARAANGVIVITTKKAKQGKPMINVSSTFTTQPYRYYTGNMTNSADVIDLEKEWAANQPGLSGPSAASYAANLLDNVAYQNQGINAILRNVAGTLSTAEMNAKLNELAGAGYRYYTDVEQYSKRNPFYQQHNISVGNTTEKNSFYSSATYRNNKNEDKYNSDESIGLNINNSTQVTKWLKMDLSSYISYGDSKKQTYNTLNPGFQFQPYDSLVNPNGSFFSSTAASRLPVNTITQINNNGLYGMDITPLQEQSWNIDRVKNFNSRTFVKLNARITDWLSFSPTFQYEYTTDRSSLLYDKNSFFVRDRVNSFASRNPSGPATFNLPYGYINRDNNQIRNGFTFRQQVNMDKKFGDKHNLTAIAGLEIRNTKIEYNSQYLYDFDPQILKYAFIDPTLLANYPGDILGSGSFLESDNFIRAEHIDRFVSLYANVGYSYDERFLLTASIRWDRSNLWASSSKYQNTPIWSAGAGWNISKESFFNVEWINMLKLRASYGTSGNVYSDTAPFLTAVYMRNYNVGGLQAYVGSRPNPQLSWEETTTKNFGVDFSMMGNRLTGTIDYYHRNGRNLLANTSGVPTEGFGYTTYSINNGEMSNKGIELSIAGDIIKSNTFNWNMGVQYAFNKNRVTYVNVEAPVYFLQLDHPEAFPRIGNPYNAIYAYKWAGLSETGLPQIFDENGAKLSYSPGTLQSIIYAGTTVPKYSGSLNNTIAYKNFSFAFLLTFEGGHKMRNTFLPMLSNNYNGNFGYISSISTVNREINNRWRQAGDENKTNIPRAVFAEDPSFSSDLAAIYGAADINVLDASNLRMRNISLAYKLPSDLAGKWGMQGVRFQFNVENAFTIAKSQNAKYLLNGYVKPNYVLGAYLNF